MKSVTGAIREVEKKLRERYIEPDQKSYERYKYGIEALQMLMDELNGV